MTFGDDDDVSTRLATHLALPIDLGLVVLCSGGTRGKAIAATKAYDNFRPTWMPALPFEALPDGGGVGDPQGMPLLKYWHASIAKNTAHIAAVQSFGRDTLLVNLDGDQLVPPEFVESCATAFSRSRDMEGLLVACKGCHGPLTGRLGYRADDFCFLGATTRTARHRLVTRMWT